MKKTSGLAGIITPTSTLWNRQSGFANESASYSEKFGADILKVKGVRRNADGFAGLYRPYREEWVEQEVTFIPYYAFANRGVSEMLVWVGIK